MEQDRLIACHDCDALFQKPRLGRRRLARCPRCGAVLYGSSTGRLDPICAMTMAALITFLIAQTFPIIELEANGITSQASLFGAIEVLWTENMQIVAVMVFCSTILFPLTELLALLYVLLSVRAGFVPLAFHQVMRAIQFVRPWGMIEVFMLGTLVTIVKMTSVARVIPEAALFAFGALTLMFAVVVTFEPRTLWEIADTLTRHRTRQTRRRMRRTKELAKAAAQRPGSNPAGTSSRGG
ncbi:paraquat-inducible protein A [Paraburkholderia sp. SARCC-3016]|uniref:paraquat-inducible protein A n=1 Tax=Paraburkholderia sp. SARCC-3016 TaxID=3058611 RepID=UPI002808B96D|nr:paraquat-inducible protein A [Paraburkholderia sp. SARCC-3016]MDQ7976511.1 paraquat-inducible protein A [Paraburkholderia sp. SARCC-3016]